MRTVLGGLLLVLAGCDRVWGLSGTVSDAGGTPDDMRGEDAEVCQGAPRWIPRIQPALMDLLDPTISRDGLEAYGTRQGALHRARRTSVEEVFLPADPISTPVNGEVYDFAMTGDELTAIYMYRSEGLTGVFQVQRASRDDEWDWSNAIPVEFSFPTGGIDLSEDGLTMWATATDDAMADTVQFEREDLIFAFGGSTSLMFKVGEGLRFPTVSRDRRTLTHHTGDADGGFVVLTRADASQLFANPTPALFNDMPLAGVDIDITHDERFMIHRQPAASGFGIVVYQRACE